MASLHQPPVSSPTIPYEGPIANSVYPGKTFVIQGYAHPDSDRFTVNLKCSPGPEIALHFDVRLNYGGTSVVLNSIVDNAWGEQVDLPIFPFARGENFEIAIVATLNAFKITVNGYDFTEYKYRIQNLSLINTISVTGQCTIYTIRFGENVDPHAGKNSGLASKERAKISVSK